MRYAKARDMDNWLQDPRIAERGFVHRWQSAVATGNGEDAFIDLVNHYLHPDCDVLDLGCGHGELTLLLANHCRSIVGIERNPDYLELAKELAAEQKITNAQFFQVNLAGVNDEDRVFAGIPLPDASIDLFINRRGPLLQRYLDEALRVARRRAVMLGLSPIGNTTAPLWAEQLPEPYQQGFAALSFDEVSAWVTEPLRKVGITDYSLWWIDVPEFLRTPYELYIRLNVALTSDLPEYQAIEPQLAKIIEQYGTPQGVVLRHQRLLWRVNLY